MRPETAPRRLPRHRRRALAGRRRGAHRGRNPASRCARQRMRGTLICSKPSSASSRVAEISSERAAPWWRRAHLSRPPSQVAPSPPAHRAIRIPRGRNQPGRAQLALRPAFTEVGVLERCQRVPRIDAPRGPDGAHGGTASGSVGGGRRRGADPRSARRQLVENRTPGA